MIQDKEMKAWMAQICLNTKERLKITLKAEQKLKENNLMYLIQKGKIAKMEIPKAEKYKMWMLRVLEALWLLEHNRIEEHPLYKKE